jgi:hypothetical protein
MADYSDLMELERKPKQSSPPVHPLPTNQPTQQEKADKPANVQAGKQTNLQTSKPESMQTDLHANVQAGKPVSMQVQNTKHPPLEKFSTYMRGDYKKRLKQLGLDKDCDAYEVLQEAVELDFQTLDKQK